MSALLHSIDPAAARPGDTVTLLGEAFELGLVVVYQAPGAGVEDPNPVLAGPGECMSVVPDLLQGLEGALLVSVVNVDEGPSNQVELTVLAAPVVQAPVELCSVGAVKQLMGVAPSETFDDVKLLAQIRIASAQIVAYCGRAFKVEEFTEWYDGNASPVLELRRTPIVEVLALKINGVEIPAAEVLVYKNWIKFGGGAEYDARLRAAGRIFPFGLQNIEVTYRAGYAEIPAEISHACMFQVMHLANTAAKQGLVGETNQQSGVTINYTQTQLAPAVRAVCNRWRRPRRGVSA